MFLLQLYMQVQKLFHQKIILQFVNLNLKVLLLLYLNYFPHSMQNHYILLHYLQLLEFDLLLLNLQQLFQLHQQTILQYLKKELLSMQFHYIVLLILIQILLIQLLQLKLFEYQNLHHHILLYLDFHQLSKTSHRILLL